LASDDGARAVLPVAEEFRDFERFHVGDQVVVSYTGNCTYSEALALAIRPDARK
jgi:hypothetical protein